MAELIGESFEAATSRVQQTALTELRKQIEVLRTNGPMSLTDTSELLRTVCEELNEMASDLHHTWRRMHPGEPLPDLAIEYIPYEELEKIGWDSHSNRVQILNTRGSVLCSIWSIFGDQSGSYAKPPTNVQVQAALEAIEARLARQP
eukprot:TRINITY_DN53049_c0_g1_i1.p1 TRINITY_DN53049_c0_g1~~TRINITY_DN53049_c0_g1_i1.p1  ORF type:complete len:165 (-),score=20.64 TRINITY_DN53049_c0_g1_i1:94-534(-)